MQTPYFLINEDKIKQNCEILERVRRESGCKILLAQKSYSCYDTYPLISKHLDGTTASGLFEAKLGHEYFGGETHVFAPAFTDADMNEIAKICDHVVFNSVAQLQKHGSKVKSAGLRVNPEFRTQESEIYDPCAPLSRFGVTTIPDGLQFDGLHFHTLCEQGFEPLRDTLAVFEQKFGKHLSRVKWVNFGGGHHITRDDYDVDGLIKLIKDFKSRYNVEVYLEPGEAVVLDAGTLTSTVLDIVHNQRDIAILDTSAACHNPDIIETQHRYTPEIIETGNHQYRFAGNTCLAGDIIGDFKSKKLNIGNTITFTNMALYTIVKTNMFNGINLPTIYVKRLDGKIEKIREFGYADYKSRLGK